MEALVTSLKKDSCSWRQSGFKRQDLLVARPDGLKFEDGLKLLVIPPLLLECVNHFLFPPASLERQVFRNMTWQGSYSLPNSPLPLKLERPGFSGQ